MHASHLKGFKSSWVAWLILAVSLLATIWIWIIADSTNERRSRQEFEFRTKDIISSLNDRLASYQTLLQGVGGLFAGSTSVTREDWQKYCYFIDLKKHFPAVQALAFARLFPAHELNAVIAATKEEGLPDFAIRPPGERDRYAVNVYSEPFEGLNIKAIGYDMWQDAIRRQTMEQAIASGEPVITPKTALKIDEVSQPEPAVIMYKYIHSEQQEGFALVPLRIHELVEDLKTLSTQNVRFSLYDGEVISDETIMYKGTDLEHHQPKYSETTTIAVAGRSWTLVFDSLPDLENLAVWQSPNTILVLGVLISLLLFGIAWGLVTAKQRAIILAEQMTASLRESERSLRRSNDELARQRSLLTSITEGTNDAVFFKDTAGRYQLANREVLRVISRPLDKVIGFDDSNFFPPEEAKVLMDGDRAIMEGGKVVVQEEYLTTVDGSRVYLAAKGPVYDADGNLAGMFGISRDITDRRNMELEMETLSQRLQMATRSAGIGIWDWNIASNTMIWDNRTLELYGYTKESFPGGIEAWRNRLHPDDQSRAWESCQAALRGEKEYNIDFRILHPDSSVTFIKADGVVLRDPDGKPLRMLGVNYDITATKTAEEQIRASNQRYQQLVDHAREGIMTVARDGRFLFVNDGICQLLGYSRDELLQLSIFDTYPEHLVQEAKARFTQLLGGGWKKFERPAKRKNGELIILEASAWQTEDGNLQAISRDITEKKALENELASSRELFSLFMRYSPVYTFIKEVTPNESRFLQASENFEQMVGIKGSDMIGQRVDRLFPPELAAKMTEDDWRVASGGVVLELEESINDRHYTTIKFPIAQEGKKLLAGFSIDVTERKRAEEETAKLRENVIQSQKLESIGKLAGGIAHDFNNMLGVIMGHTELALNELGAAHPLSGHLQEIELAATRSAAITRQLLAFARKQAISPKTLNLNQAMEPMLKMIQRLIGEDIQLSWLPGEDLWNVHIDPSQVDQILANLATNARDAISGVGSVRITTGNARIDDHYCADHPGFHPGEYVVLSMSDSGTGIPSELLPQIFDPFFTTKEVDKGTGLGLATIYGIVKQNGGFLNVSSTLGKGTVFSIYLPKTATAPATDNQTSVVTKAGCETVLVVEDETASLNLLNKYLTSLGYTVFPAASPQEGLRLAGSLEHIDLLITDVVMPGMDGRQLAKELSTMHRGLRCIYMSGYTYDTLLDRGVIPEDMHFVQKPYALKEMAATIRTVLES